MSSPIPSSSTPSPPTLPSRLAGDRATLLIRPALLGLLVATLLVILLLFAGSEDRGFIYVDF